MVYSIDASEASDLLRCVQVKVTLRSMADVLPGFKAAWDAWVDRAAVPVRNGNNQELKLC